MALEDSQQTLLTYADVKEAHPGWSDVNVEDYLSIKQDLAESAQSLEEAESEISDNQRREVYPWDYSDSSLAESAMLQALFSSLIPEVKQWRAVTTRNSYTALDHDFINAYAGATISFPRYPGEGEAITIRNGDDSKVKLDGNGKKLNGEAAGIINRKGTCIDFYYFIDTDEWFAR